MRLLVLDESRERSTQLIDLLKKSRHEVECISNTNDFIAKSTGKSVPDRILVDADSWRHGKAIYDYFGIGLRLESIPLTIYNSPEGFAGPADRPRHNADVLLPKTATIEQVAGSLG
jgi:hypothetical protein